MAFAVMAVAAQTQENPYIVKTKGAKKVTVSQSAKAATGGNEEEEQEAHDFISENFRYYSMCDWQDGMRFMVRPEKKDLIVSTFCDAATGKEVGSGRLRNKIMVYKGFKYSEDNHVHVMFKCEDDSKDYYFEIPNGGFEEYCYGKFGVPTLAYLGDIDIARTKLVGQKMFTRTTTYYIDTEYDGDGIQEVTIPKNEEVTVVSVGVGTRSFPVKIIVADKNGKEFFQNVAISKTNSGMRDDEFIMDNTKNLFAGSFELIDANMAVSSDYATYVKKVVHTKYATNMQTKGDGKDRTVKVPRLTEFTIEEIKPNSNTNYVTLTLKDNESRRIYYKDVTFVNDNVAGDIDGYKEDYFGYLFAMGEGKLRNTSVATRAMIRQGRVAPGFSEEEVEMALGEPDRTASANNGRYDWIYRRSKSWLIVQFGANKKVVGVKVSR